MKYVEVWFSRSCMHCMQLVHLYAELITCISYKCWMAHLVSRQTPASFRRPGLESQIEELPRLMPLRVFPTFWRTQILLSCVYQVLRWFYEVYSGKVV